MSQRWATHRSPTYEPVEGGYDRRIVFCDTEYFSYPTFDRNYGMCKLYGGKTSFSRCISCDNNDGFGKVFYAVIPPPVLTACVYRDVTYNAARQGCKDCLEKTECINKSLKKKFKLRVIK